MKAEFNKKLQAWDNRIPNKFAGKGNIEQPGKYENIIWQNRSSIPSDFQMALSEGLQSAYENTTGSISELVNHLNTVGIVDENGKSWSEASLTDYILRVGG